MAGDRQSKGQRNPIHYERAAGCLKIYPRITKSAQLCSGELLAQHANARESFFHLT
jgi:hypothetical protein